jgi:hypothetical protein
MQETPDIIELAYHRNAPLALQTSNNVAARYPVRERSRIRGSRNGRVDPGSGIERNSRPRMSRRESTLEVAAKEHLWSWDRRQGISIEAIAAREGVSIGRVRFGVARARAHEKAGGTASAVRPPRLVPLFPIGAYTPQSTCGHRRPIEPGSSLCCMVCHTSGMDRHPALRRDPRSDPTPEPKAALSPESVKRQRETRKERRRRLYGGAVS